MATETTPKPSPAWVRGVFDALVAVRRGRDSFCPGPEEMQEIADALGVPVLLIEASQTYDFDAIEQLVAWWPAMRGPA